MKKRQFTCGITFFTTPLMYKEIKKVSDDLEVGLSDFLRQLIGDYLRKNFPDSTTLSIGGNQQ